VISSILALALVGCAKKPYEIPGELYPSSPEAVPEQQISRGEPIALIDYTRHLFFSLPEKLFLWNWRMGYHEISPATEAAMRSYVETNQLKEVKVRLNEYDPLDDFERLTNNDSVGAGWRYTLGALTVLVETILPGRVFGGDHYNPFTNTIHLYSDLPVVALHEGGHAKDFASTKYKGTNAVLRLLPLVPLHDEYVASSDALSYTAHEVCNAELHESGYKLLYPAYGTYIGGQLAEYVPAVRQLAVLAVIPGHIVGRIKASFAAEEVCQTPQQAGGTPQK
jgi:hypothetical protein